MENYYADLAFVFHWSISEMDKLSLEELMEFQEMARVRHEGKSA
ncbi:GpE family phage tail protein [Vibrio sp. OPT18]|nr:GpE family phage tail protein [Vibrio sp. OPT18]